MLALYGKKKLFYKGTCTNGCKGSKVAEQASFEDHLGHLTTNGGEC
jgi:hypothetical protein